MSQYSESSYSEDPNSAWFKASKYIKAKSLVLDVGCSSGKFGDELIKRNSCIVDGIELDNGDYNDAKKRLRNVYRLNVETDNLSDIKDTYDFIYFGDVIEHLVSPVKTLRRVKKLLKPEGKIAFSIPNMSHISVRLMLLSGKFDYGHTGLLDVTHLHFYTYKEVRRVFAESGYVIINIDPVYIDYPKELVNKELGELGLATTAEFMQFAKNTEASVYQFVGLAEPNVKGDKKSKQLDIISPADKFQTYLDETKKYYVEMSKADKLHIAKQEKIIKDISLKLEETNRQIESLSKNPVIRLIIRYKSKDRKK